MRKDPKTGTLRPLRPGEGPPTRSRRGRATGLRCLCFRPRSAGPTRGCWTPAARTTSRMRFLRVRSPQHTTGTNTSAAPPVPGNDRAGIFRPPHHTRPTAAQGRRTSARPPRGRAHRRSPVLPQSLPPGEVGSIALRGRRAGAGPGRAGPGRAAGTAGAAAMSGGGGPRAAPAAPGGGLRLPEAPAAAGASPRARGPAPAAARAHAPRERQRLARSPPREERASGREGGREGGREPAPRMRGPLPAGGGGAGRGGASRHVSSSSSSSGAAAIRGAAVRRFLRLAAGAGEGEGAAPLA